MKRMSIAQEYFILAADKNGMMPPMRREECNAGLVAAGFMDLLLHEVITAEKKRITVVRELPQELGHLASLHGYLKEKSRSADNLMTDFYTGRRINQLTDDIGESLITGGIAAKGQGGIFGPKITYIPDAEYKTEFIQYIKTRLASEEQLTAEDITLIHILQATKNLNSYISKEEREEWKTRLKEIKKNPESKQLADMINYVSDWTTMVMAWFLTYIV